MPGVDDERVRVEVAVPPDVTVTLDGLREPVTPEGKDVAERETVPEKPLMLAREIVAVGAEGD